MWRVSCEALVIVALIWYRVILNRVSERLDWRLKPCWLCCAICLSLLVNMSIITLNRVAPDIDAILRSLSLNGINDWLCNRCSSLPLSGTTYLDIILLSIIRVVQTTRYMYVSIASNTIRVFDIGEGNADWSCKSGSTVLPHDTLMQIYFDMWWLYNICIDKIYLHISGMVNRHQSYGQMEDTSAVVKPHQNVCMTFDG